MALEYQEFNYNTFKEYEGLAGNPIKFIKKLVNNFAFVLERIGSTGQYVYFVDPDSKLKFRQGIRAGALVLDKELTALGFSGVEDTDWENLSIQQ